MNHELILASTDMLEAVSDGVEQAFRTSADGQTDYSGRDQNAR